LDDARDTISSKACGDTLLPRVAHSKENLMNLTKMLGALLMIGATLTAAPIAHASGGDAFTPSEIAYLNDLGAEGMGPAVSAQGLVDEGWTICRALTSGMSPTTAAEKVYSGSNTANTNGVSQTQSVHVVAHAMDDLCPSPMRSGFPA
jgi:hypothetical protein